MTAAPPIVERRKPARGWRGWRGPTEHKPFPSLGWLFLDWTYDHLPSPTDETKPLIYTDEQARRIVKWFEIHPITGEFIWTTLILEEAKGWGKSPFAASLDIGEMAGPVCFDGWDADGEPVGVPWGTGGRLVPWIQIAALSEDQTANTYGALYGLLASRGGKVADDLRLDLGRTKVYHRDMPTALLEPVTSSAGSRTGQRLTAYTADETWLLKPNNGGTRLLSTLRFNIAKTNGRAVETTNAPVLGEHSVAEQADPDAPMAGVLHYATRPAKSPEPNDPDDVLDAKLAEVYGEVPWVVRPRFVRDIRDPRTEWDDVMRLFFNIRTTGQSRAIDPRLWDVLRVPRDIPAGTPIGVGFDGSTYRDATVLRACTQWGYTFILGRWSRPAGVDDWQVPRGEVDQVLAEAFERYRVGRVFCDPPGWRTEIDRWAERWGEDIVVALDTNQAVRMVPAIDRWLTGTRTAGAMIKDAAERGLVGPLDLPYAHDGDEFTAAQVKATRLRKVQLAELDDDRTRYMLEKDGQIGSDALVADILAYEAAMTMEVVDEPEPFILVGSR